MKRCVICDELKDLNQFHKHSGNTDGYRNDCKICRKNKKKRDKNPSHKRCPECDVIKSNTEAFFYISSKGGLRNVCILCMNLKAKHYHILNRYGLTQENHNKMIENQSGRCAICKTDGTRLVVDHNHLTGKIRSLLCDGCNTGIGMFKENTKLMKKAIKYINDYLEVDHHDKTRN